MPALILLAAAAAASTPGWARSFIKHTLNLTEYRAASIDLDGDGRPEVLVLSDGQEWCGSGGCYFFVLARHGRMVREAARTTITRAPIRVLPSISHGWHDLGILVAEGGIIPGYTARLRYDGRHYPENPTVPPAEPMRHPSGRIVLDTLPLLPSQLAR